MPGILVVAAFQRSTAGRQSASSWVISSRQPHGVSSGRTTHSKCCYITLGPATGLKFFYITPRRTIHSKCCYITLGPATRSKFFYIPSGRTIRSKFFYIPSGRTTHSKFFYIPSGRTTHSKSFYISSVSSKHNPVDKSQVKSRIPVLDTTQSTNFTTSLSMQPLMSHSRRHVSSEHDGSESANV